MGNISTHITTAISINLSEDDEDSTDGSWFVTKKTPVGDDEDLIESSGEKNVVVSTDTTIVTDAWINYIVTDGDVYIKEDNLSDDNPGSSSSHFICSNLLIIGVF